MLQTRKEFGKTLRKGKAQEYTPRPKKFVPPGTICGHCGFKGHYKIDCYRLVGYPPGFQSFRPNFKPNAHFTRNADDFNDRGKQDEGAHFARNADDFYDRGKQAEGHMTPPQYQDLVNRMDKAGTSDCVANMSEYKEITVMEYKFQHEVDMISKELVLHKF
ncbi:hypothetical protein H5410_032895 [Solanum commersonii]|uniref:CCHC-type domain-containing protein n=1 Tax=Solanum commersonii TaxID=4109 RepID=A0A9J5YNK0_SOLCO|nr:hypothetical protein H5410_032895 [Solanum commersonii]